MIDTSNTIQPGEHSESPAESYNADSDLVDYILGITFEIWEQGQIEKIHDYYSSNVEVYGLDSMTCSASDMVENTHATLASYPDRLLIADDVITAGTTKKGFSSHRITGPMTNLGDTAFGPGTGKHIQATNIADCEVNDGLITREWLVRDGLAVIKQLGFDPIDCAKVIAGNFDDRQKAWLSSEFARVSDSKQTRTTSPEETDEALAFAHEVLTNCWVKGDRKELESVYAPYCLLKRAPFSIYSGRDQVLEHYSNWRDVFPGAKLSVDHVCSQPFDQNKQRIAVRWSVAGFHESEFSGMPASGKPIYILGVTHWQLVDGRISAEWTVFDELAMLAQTQI